MSKKALCLNMIVKNEMANLERCLKSVAPYIACWVIGDTGSTDGTQAFIRDFFAERQIPGELHEFPFVDFEATRNEALRRAQGSSLAFDYILLTDADMELRVDDPHAFDAMSAEVYQLLQKAGVSYWNSRLVRKDAKAWYRGVTHEFLHLEDGKTEKLSGAWFRDHATGANRVDKYERDERLLRAALESETDPRMISRYTFYLANTLRDAGREAEAIPEYEKRVTLGGWREEQFVSLYHIAKLKEKLDYPADEVIAAYDRATELIPGRAEGLHGAARFCRNKGLYERGLPLAARGLRIPRPAVGLFVHDWIYEYGLLDEYAVLAYWTGHYAESLDACLQLLASDALRKSDAKRVAGNAIHARRKLAVQGRLPKFPSYETKA